MLMFQLHVVDDDDVTLQLRIADDDDVQFLLMLIMRKTSNDL
jgi:hypothetical protein